MTYILDITVLPDWDSFKEIMEHIFSWRNKYKINTFVSRIVTYLELCLIKVNGSFVPYLNKTNEGPEEKLLV